MERRDIDAIVEDGRFELAETHISWVLIGKSHVFKIKKPVKFSFLDFSTLARRKMFCDEEVRLNRRLAPDVYIGVVPITSDGGKMMLDGSGGIMDYAVKMLRLDRDLMMDKLLAKGKVSEKDVRSLAAMVASFHEKAEVAGGKSPKTIGSQIADLGNFRDAIEKAAGLGKSVDLILERSAGFVKKNEALLKKRMAQGKVKDCHGDLHSGNIFFDHGIRIIDCIEFSRDFRCVDVASDIAFMAMDLDYHGRADLSSAFVDEYIARSRDEGVKALVVFYKCYRANVRAKIAAIEWMGGNSEASKERIAKYIKLAQGYAKSL
jgi:aminoglycoside phosphotransferase family enzyme